MPVTTKNKALNDVEEYTPTLLWPLMLLEVKYMDMGALLDHSQHIHIKNRIDMHCYPIQAKAFIVSLFMLALAVRRGMFTFQPVFYSPM